jgi:TetR/AcrR family transcriptional regulator, multidrug resistance operon repressor
MAPNPTIDRAAAVRQAMRTLVARYGLHGASMSAIAKEAGVAQGTAYAHYQSKEQLLVAAYLELKAEMGIAACADIDRSASPHDRFIQVWLGVYSFLAEKPERAQFMLQIESSPYARVAHELGMAVPDDPMMAEAEALNDADVLAPLEIEILYDLAYWPAIRRAAVGDGVDVLAARPVAEACWRAITTP